MLMPRLTALERDFDVKGRIRPVYPLAVRTPEFFETRDPLWFSYFMTDIAREAAFLGMPIRWPRPDPVFMDMATRTFPKEQPHIHRLTHMGVAAAERGRGLEFLAEASRVIWSGEVDGWHEGDHLAGAAAARVSTRRSWPGAWTRRPSAWRRWWRRARSPSGRLATTACRCWCSTASPSSARTGSIRPNGAWSNRA